MSTVSLSEGHPLPPIGSQFAERIFFHRSLGRTPVQTANGIEDDDNDRLAFLGDQVLQMCITDILFQRCPCEKTSILSPRKAYLISKPQLAKWSDLYDLPSRIKGPEHQLLTIQSNKLQRAQVFQAYIAAYFLEAGYLHTKAWLGPVIDATYEDMLTETENEEVENILDDDVTESSTTPPQSSAPLTPVSSPRRDRLATPLLSPRPTPTSPVTPLKSPTNALSIFNQTCAQNKLEPAWTELTEGPSHQRTFTMTLKVQGNSEILGRGKAATKKQAQQVAAEEGLKKLNAIIGQRQ